VGFECTEHLMHINSCGRQKKFGSGVGFEPTIRLRRINSQASIGVLQNAHEECIQSSKLAPAVGFEPTTNRLTADRSTTELRWIFFLRDYGAVDFALCNLRWQVLPCAQKLPLKPAAAQEAVRY
jgi:hypothetical protein